MSKKFTKEQFVKRSNKKHGNKYNYDLFIYKNKNTVGNIICPKHGIFSQSPANHYNKTGCEKCINYEILKETIEKANKIHNNKYDYSKFRYKGYDVKSTIICLIHGDFKQTPHDHLNGSGCRKCFIESKILPIDEFIKRSNQFHNNKYDYSLVKYNNLSDKVNIICPIHGKFLQMARVHMQQSGCQKCFTLKFTNNEFIQKANIVHNNFYDYSLCNYIGSKNKIVIICNYHDKFEQIASSHLQGYGCPECGKEKSIQSQYSNKFFKENPQKKNNNAILYLVKLTSKENSDVFYKIGITIYDIERRFVDLKQFFDIEKIFIKHCTLFECFNLEQTLLKQIKKTQIRPKKTRMYKNGESECFYADKEYILNLIKILS